MENYSEEWFNETLAEDATPERRIELLGAFDSVYLTALKHNPIRAEKLRLWVVEQLGYVKGGWRRAIFGDLL